MRKFFVLSLCFLLSAPVLITAKGKKARTSEDYSYIDYKKSEIYIQYGAPTILELTNKFNNTSFTAGNVTYKYKDSGTKYTGVGAVGYNFYINPYLSLGAYFGISEADMTIKEEVKHTEIYQNHVRNYTGMLSVHWTYFRNGIWEASCGCSLGMAKKDERQEIYNPANKSKIPVENDSYNFAYNLTATRVRVGGTLGGFLELGFGYKGLVNAGLSVKF